MTQTLPVPAGVALRASRRPGGRPGDAGRAATPRTRIETRGFVLDEREARGTRSRLAGLARRLAPGAEPLVTLVLTRRGPPHRFEAELCLRMGPLGPHLVGHTGAAAPVAAVRRAVDAVAQQLGHPGADRPDGAGSGASRRRRPGHTPAAGRSVAHLPGER